MGKKLLCFAEKQLQQAGLSNEIASVTSQGIVLYIAGLSSQSSLAKANVKTNWLLKIFLWLANSYLVFI